MIEAVVFDVGGVIGIETKEGVAARAARILRIPFEEYIDAKVKIAKPWEAGLSDAETFKRIGKQLGIKAEEIGKAEERAYREIFRANKPVIMLAGKLRKAGYKTPILTNVCWLHKAINTEWGLYDKFSPVICSCDIGCAKPARKIYDITLSKIRVPAEQTVFIDDQDANVYGANKAGIHGIVFRNITQLKKDLVKLGVKVK